MVTQGTKALREVQDFDHSLDNKHVSHWFSTNDLRAHGGGSGPLLNLPSSTSHHQPNGIFPTLSTITSGAVLVGRFLGCPSALPVVGFPRAPSLKPSSLPSPPPPDRPCCQQPPLRDSPFSGCHPHRSCCGSPIKAPVEALTGESLLPCLPQRSKV